MVMETIATDEQPARQTSIDVYERQRAVRRRWPRRSLLLVAAVAAIGVAATFIPLARSSRPVDPGPIHTVERGELIVTVTEQGTLESSENSEIKCRVRGENTITWVIESGTVVKPGDELLRLDTLTIEEEISERKKYAHLSRSTAERSKANMEAAEIAIKQYEEGTFVAELAGLQQELAIAEANLRTARNLQRHTSEMFDSDYATELDVEEREFEVLQRTRQLDAVKTRIDVLTRFTKAMQLESLKGDLAAARAQYEADKERAYADAMRRDRALEEFRQCVIKAERNGIVIYPTGEAWKEAPEIEEGATVHKDQTLLLMPDLTKMQVKVGIHESVIERVQVGLPASVTLPDKKLQGEISYVSPVTRPAGWWTGNVVKYDVIVQLPETEALKPGMTAEVEVVLARHEDVLLLPVTSVVATDAGRYCWVKTPSGVQRRAVQMGDSNNDFVQVTAGLQEGDEVAVDPLAFIEEAQLAAAQTLGAAQREDAAASTRPSESSDVE